jgi:predicted phage terminase large subunit-like protein
MSKTEKEALKHKSVAQIEIELRRLKRVQYQREAKTSLARFIHLMMPDEEFPEDPELTEYQTTPPSRLLCAVIEKVYRSELMRTAVSIPPQHGKTIHLSTYGPAWMFGLNPRLNIVVATYNETRADELGEAFRAAVTSETYRAIFPGVELMKGSQSKSYMRTTVGGKIFFVGAGGTITGRGADIFIIDDPMKDDEELQNDNYREKIWKWFFSVAYSRGSKRTRIIVLHTRWHVDDLLGRLCDPSHPERKKRFKDIAEDWTYLNISGVVLDPAIAKQLGLTLTVPTDPKVIRAFGEKPMAALWEADKDLPFFAQWKIGEPRTFSALVMGQPSIEDGEFFKLSDIVEYDLEELPERLKKYGSSDHAVSVKARRDYTVAGCIGVDEDDTIWVLPDLTWDRIETDRQVEDLLYHFKTHRPGLWFMESELISKSFGPFLKKRMLEERIYTTIQPIIASKDKRVRARSIQGRMQMHKVRFPRFAPWWADARSELLQFDHGAHDDFVDFLSNVGNGLLYEQGASRKSQDGGKVVRVGSPEWILRQSLRRGKQERREAASRGW